MEAKDYLRILTGDYIILPLYVSGCLPLRPLTPGQVRGGGGGLECKGAGGASTGSGRERGGGHGQGSRLLTNVGGKEGGGGDYDRFKIERRGERII